jgi:hypothetical protein
MCPLEVAAHSELGGLPQTETLFYELTFIRIFLF